MVPKPDSEGTKTAPGASRERIGQCGQLARGDARHVARDGEEAPRPAGEGRSLGVGDGFRVAAVGLLAECARPVAPRQRLDRWVARDDQHQADLRAGQRVEDVLEHGARQVAALGRREKWDEPLLGVDEVLDGDRDDGAHASASSARRARAISPSRSRMTVSVTMVRIPAASMRGVSAASWLSTSRMSSQGA